MDKGTEITYKMVEAAIDKGIHDIEENANRGIRNLVDLGSHLSTGTLQKGFFQLTQQMLKNDNSPYYELIRHLVWDVDHNILKDFGIHFGYNSLAYGMQIIRENENQYGYFFPAALVFDFQNQTDKRLLYPEISNVLLQGEKLGIYCGIFFAGNDKTYLQGLINMLGSHTKGAYIIFAEPEMIDEETAEAILKVGNTAILLDLQKDNELFNKAVTRLINKKCLFGTYCEYDDSNIEYILSDLYIKQIKAAHAAAHFYLRKNLDDSHKIKCFSQFIEQSRCAKKYPFFIIDFYEDLAHIGRDFSAFDCFLSIKSDGQIAVTTLNQIHPELNIRTHSLQTIMEKIMPKCI